MNIFDIPCFSLILISFMECADPKREKFFLKLNDKCL